jgi:hypothetical protein
MKKCQENHLKKTKLTRTITRKLKVRSRNNRRPTYSTKAFFASRKSVKELIHKNRINYLFTNVLLYTISEIFILIFFLVWVTSNFFGLLGYLTQKRSGLQYLKSISYLKMYVCMTIIKYRGFQPDTNGLLLVSEMVGRASKIIECSDRSCSAGVKIILKATTRSLVVIIATVLCHL